VALVALTSYPHTRPLTDGTVTPDGLKLDFDPLAEGSIFPAFRKMARTQCFDISEFGISTALCAVEQGLPIRLLPVFVTRRFDHGGVFVRADSPVTALSELRRPRVAVKSYTVTDVVWSAGMLVEALGSLDGVTWRVTSDEHLAEQQLPASATPADATPAELLARGEADVIFDPKAGGSPGIRPLFPDERAAELSWFAAKGYVPPHHTVIVRESVLAADPRAGAALQVAFAAAKAPFLERLAAGQDVIAEDQSSTGPRHDYGVERTADLQRPDPLPYGLAANLAAIEDVLTYLREMGLVSSSRAAEDFFVHVPD
jgi:4,5-dihydroxyphthalate decarboxylase